MAVRTLFLSAWVTGCYGHGSMSFPKPRNAIDANLHPWNAWSYPKDAVYFDESATKTAGSCPVATHNGEKGTAKSNGQACFWFSNGCTIGCEKCDGTQNHAGHEKTAKFLYKGLDSAGVRKKNITVPPYVPKPGDMKLNPNLKPMPYIKSICGNTSAKATICDSHLRTMNTQAECGSPEDIYYLSPWRAPGSAPVIDACGSAGGRNPWQGQGEAGASFQNSSVAKEGDLGSKLPPMPSQATWEAGSNVEVGWALSAQHGGGYAYRLAPADAPLTEETFRKMPVDMVGSGILRWGGDKSTQLEFNATRVTTGTVPKGSMWAKSPIPRGADQWEQEGPAYLPVCQESEDCTNLKKKESCRCSGSVNSRLLVPNLEIVDTLHIPADLVPGQYVLQWRWDCEETDQVWASCSDVTVAPSASTVHV